MPGVLSSSQLVMEVNQGQSIRKVQSGPAHSRNPEKPDIEYVKAVN
jgi:hypothetical protein